MFSVFHFLSVAFSVSFSFQMHQQSDPETLITWCHRQSIECVINGKNGVSEDGEFGWSEWQLFATLHLWMWHDVFRLNVSMPSIDAYKLYHILHFYSIEIKWIGRINQKRCIIISENCRLHGYLKIVD